MRYVEDGHLDIDNNRYERSLKPFVIGRANWLFANTARGARARAVRYSIVETAKDNGLNTTAYLKYLFERMPNMDLDDRRALDKLMPWSKVLPDPMRVKGKSSRKGFARDGGAFFASSARQKSFKYRQNWMW
ncbi:transposase IS66 [Alicyclobacillus hesperidum URH17-3-68]|nr:transposase IS66 [Alicyclobacillus hesperidum URH17-3-68]